MTDTPELTDDAAVYLIEKRGFYYRPDAAGHTGVKAEAGRYTFEEAAVHVGPNGPEGPQDGMSMWHEDEAPEFSSRCPWDTRLKAELAAALARAEAAEAERDRLLEALKRITTPSFGLQSVQEDYGHDANAYNYHGMQYWKDECGRLRAITRAALNTQEGEE